MLLSKYFSEETDSAGEYIRSAEVKKNINGYYVDFYENGHKFGSTKLYDHTESYAEDAAENWVLGINKETWVI